MTLSWWINGIQQTSIEKDIGEIPVMLRSKFCNLHGLSPKELVDKGEHESEWGGYFVVKGHEKLIRLLMLTRGNYPLFIIRPSWEARGKQFSDKGVLVRCVGKDRSQTVS